MSDNKTKLWSESEEQVLRSEYSSGLELDKIAASHRRTVGAIRTRLKRIGLISITKCGDNELKIKRDNILASICGDRPRRGVHVNELERYKSSPLVVESCIVQRSDYFFENLIPRLQFLDLSTENVECCLAGTLELSTELVNVCNELGYTTYAEVKTDIKRPNSDRCGVVDFVTYSDIARYAIEIDSTDKKWSLKKLIALENRGYIPVWIRWKSKVRVTVPKSITLISLFKEKHCC